MIPQMREGTMPMQRTDTAGAAHDTHSLPPPRWMLPLAVSAPPLASRHAAHVHAVAVDATGKFLATCSSDRRVNIFTRYLLKKAPKSSALRLRQDAQRHYDDDDDDESHAGSSSSSNDDELVGDNHCVVSAHHSPWQHQVTLSDLDSPAYKVAWARHDKNVYLAAAGGRRLKLYAMGWQRPAATNTAQQLPPRLVASLTSEADSNGDISDIVFCPPSHIDKELILSCASLDGYVRFYLPTEASKIAPRYTKVSPSEDIALSSAVLTKVGTAVSAKYTVCRIHVARQGSSAVGAVSVTGILESVVAIPEMSTTAPVAANNKTPSVAAILLRSLKTPSPVTALGWLQTPASQYSSCITGTDLGTVDGYMLTRRDHKAMYVPMMLTAPALLTNSGGDPDQLVSPSGAVVFSQLRLPGAVTCVSWAPGVGRLFDLVAIGSRKGTAILRLSTRQLSSPNGSSGASGNGCLPLPSPSPFVAELPGRAPAVAAWEGEVFFTPHAPCVSASWDPSGTLLSVMDDKADSQGFVVLHPTDWANHQSWAIMSAP